MPAFRFKHGDRPLDGYTIQRGIGRGGFGEVYYALSDSGREVAIKAIQTFEEIELRGTGQCMNLKSPHLVTIFDVKRNEEAVPFVIMEYVAGPSLRGLLDDAPAGLGPQKAAFFLREIGKGLTFLHDCGIVHRDLKPANIFYENGYVKIGDYGLSKAIGAGQHSAQTITVGTVHYMAPEVGAGHYDKAIDIYALGAVLYEMLTGQVPFLGGSAGEILMKHLTAEPRLEGIEEPFRTVIRKAMAKDAKERYGNVQEMVEAVFGAEHVRQSVSCFSPDHLSMVAERVARRVEQREPVAAGLGGGGFGTGESSTVSAPPRTARRRLDLWDEVGNWVDRTGDRLAQMGGRVAAMGERALPPSARRRGPGGETTPPENPSVEEIERRDPLGRRQRRLLAAVTMTLVSMAAGIFVGDDRLAPPPVISVLFAFTAMLGASGGILIARDKLLPKLRQETVGIQRLASGGLAGLFLILLSLPAWMAAGSRIGSTMAGLLAPLFLLNWMDWTSPRRRRRVSFKHAAIAGVIALVLAAIFNGRAELALAILAGTSLAVQVLSPWDAQSGRAAGAKSPDVFKLGDYAVSHAGAAPAGSADAAGTGQDVRNGPPPLPNRSTRPPSSPEPLIKGESRTACGGVRAWRAAPVWMKTLLWPLAMVATGSSGLMLLIVPLVVSGPHREERAAMTGAGLGLLVAFLFSLVRTCQSRFRSWWGYVWRPMIMLACVEAISISWSMLGLGNPRGGEAVAAVFFIVVPSMLLLALLFVRLPWSAAAGTSPKSAAEGGIRPDSTTGEVPVQRAAITPATGVPSGSMAGKAAAIASASGNAALGLLAAVFLLAAIVCGILMAIDLPGMLAAGVIDPKLPSQLNREFGFAQWPQLMRTQGWVLTYLGVFVATVMLILARRRTSGLHLLRVPLAAAGLLGAIALLGHAFAGRWEPVIDERGVSVPLAAIEQYLNYSRTTPALMALVVGSLALVTLSWPAARRKEGGA